MPELHRQRLFDGGEPIAASLRAALDLRPWTERAACAGQEQLFDGETPHPYREPGPTQLASPAALHRLAYCSACPVRRECLTDALTPHRMPDRIVDVDYVLTSQKLVEGGAELRVWGTWGGSDERDRLLTRDLPIDERIEVLEATFPERLRIRREAWLAAVAMRKKPTRLDRQIAELLGVELPPTRSVTAAKHAAITGDFPSVSPSIRTMALPAVSAQVDTNGHAGEPHPENEHFFQVYKDLEGHKVSTEGFEDRLSAEAVIRAARDRAADPA